MHEATALIFLLLGFGLVVLGLLFIYAPLAPITGGLGLIGLALAIDPGPDPEEPSA